MQLDMHYIEVILCAVQAHPKSQIQQKELLAAIGTKEEDEIAIDKFNYHMMRMNEVGFLESRHHENNGNFGFIWHNQGRSLFNTDYELTWSGCEFLEALNNESMKAKIVTWFKDMTLEQIKQQAPILLIKLILQGNLMS